jgi:hypothetical protein
VKVGGSVACALHYARSSMQGLLPPVKLKSYYTTQCMSDFKPNKTILIAHILAEIFLSVKHMIIARTRLVCHCHS